MNRKMVVVAFPALGLVVLLLALFPMLTGCDLLSKEPGNLKIGVLPILDTLPLYVADQEGFFESEGIEVELLPFSSALERDVAMQTDQIDGEINDLISAALLNNEDDRVRVVRTAMRATPEKAMFAILSIDGAIQSSEDLKGKQIGMSTNSIIEYVVDRLLRADGLAEDDIIKQEVPKIPVRLELLTSGQIPAACLPEPLASRLAGATSISSVETSMAELTRKTAEYLLRTSSFNLGRAFAYLYLREQQMQSIHTTLKARLLSLDHELVTSCAIPEQEAA